ncbi:Uncharacterized protein dnm_006780 [Desulfonema magnum]|uniref:Uncharacterized protein n=1 Tax=Desulfonema magnum TaxID=45655 RepID=A0A975BFA0_9BACT|nr:Uncharacterized protein dnm_006780 [Desulfonema magnum]
MKLFVIFAVSVDRKVFGLSLDRHGKWGRNPICIRLRLPDGVCNPVRNVCFRGSENISDGVANPVRQITG